MLASYIHHLPREVPKKALQGAALAGALTMMAGYSLNTTLKTASFVASTTVVEALTRPITRAIFERSQFSAMMTQIFLPSYLTARIAEIAAPTMIPGIAAYHSTSRVLRVVSWLLLNDLPPFGERRNIAIAGLF